MSKPLFKVIDTFTGILSLNSLNIILDRMKVKLAGLTIHAVDFEIGDYGNPTIISITMESGDQLTICSIESNGLYIRVEDVRGR